MRSFFRIYKEKFWRLTLLNLLHFLLTLPLLFVFYICVNAAVGIRSGDSLVDVLPGLGFYMSLFPVQSTIGRVFVVASVVVSALLFGPLKFLMTDVCCAFYTGRFRFFTDSVVKLRERLPQAFALGLIDVLVLGRLILNISGIQLFFHMQALGVVNLLLRAVSLIVLLFWVQLRRYFYVLSCNAKLKTIALLKNSLILSLTEFGSCSRVSVACILIWALTYLTLPIVTVILLPIFAASAALLAHVCYLYPVVEFRVLHAGEKQERF